MDRRKFIKGSLIVGGTVALLPGCLQEEVEKAAAPEEPEPE